MILGSGFAGFEAPLTNAVDVPFAQVPHLASCTVDSHASSLTIGELDGVGCCLFRGRVHWYEGHSAAAVVRSVRLAYELGVSHLVVTNAAGGIRPDLHPGDFMLIADHLNLMGVSPLRGDNDDTWGPRFPDLTEAYSAELREMAEHTAAGQGLPVKSGVYAGLGGPQYETPAEVRMLRHLGADAVGMSTVLEVIAARHLGLHVLGISCITNHAAGHEDGPLSHEEVVAMSQKVREPGGRWLTTILSEIARITSASARSHPAGGSS